ncbi:MAG: nitronate monooxygenase [Calditrichia bacterium]
MLKEKLPELRIGSLKLDTPIVQGGMGVGISLSGLAAAVANAGGIGVISSVALGLLDESKSRKYREANLIMLREEIRRARRLSGGVIGLNIMVALTDYLELLECAIEEQVDIVFMGAGLPLKFPERYSAEEIRRLPTHFAPIVSSGRAAGLIFKHWEKHFGRIPDAVVVEGPKAGGHLGFRPEQIFHPAYQLENLIPEVVQVVKGYEERYQREIPVIAAGGIYDGADMARFLELGARGIQMGTRFVATEECDASAAFKQSYIDCREEDIQIIQSPVGLPGRAIRNRFLEEVKAGEKKPFRCSWKCLKSCDFRTTPYCIADALANAQKGQLLKGFTFAGANAHRVDRIVKVKELFAELQREYAEALRLAPACSA